MASLSFSVLFYLVQTRRPLPEISQEQTVNEKKIDNVTTEEASQALSQEEGTQKAEEFMQEVEKNNPARLNETEEEKIISRQKAEEFMARVENNNPAN